MPCHRLRSLEIAIKEVSLALVYQATHSTVKFIKNKGWNDANSKIEQWS